jgi:hypothetical protein
MYKFKMPRSVFGVIHMKTDGILDLIEVKWNKMFIFKANVDAVLYGKLSISENYLFKLLFTYKIPVSMSILKPVTTAYYFHHSKCQKCT